MSAIVCGKRSFFEELPSPNSQRSSAVEHLVAAFPGMDKQLVKKVLDECGDDLDSAIRSLNDLCLSNAGKLNGELESNSQLETRNVAAAADLVARRQLRRAYDEVKKLW